MISKRQIFESFQQFIEDKIESSKMALNQTAESILTETKGSAGDKHETSRAMAQIEVDKAGRILQEALQMRSIFQLLEPDAVCDSCNLGAVVHTSNGIFYLSTGIGRIPVGEDFVFCVGMKSPIGQAMINKKEGDFFQINDKSIKIEKIY